MFKLKETYNKFKQGVKDKAKDTYLETMKGYKIYKDSDYEKDYIPGLKERQKLLSDSTLGGRINIGEEAINFLKTKSNYESHTFESCSKASEYKKKFQKNLDTALKNIHIEDVDIKLQKDVKQELVSMIPLLGTRAIEKQVTEKDGEKDGEKVTETEIIIRNTSWFGVPCIAYSKYMDQPYHNSSDAVNIGYMKNAISRVKDNLEKDTHGEILNLADKLLGKLLGKLSSTTLEELNLKESKESKEPKPVTEGGRKSKKARKGRKGRRTKNKRKRQTKKKRGKKRH